MSAPHEAFIKALLRFADTSTQAVLDLGSYGIWARPASDTLRAQLETAARQEITAGLEAIGGLPVQVSTQMGDMSITLTEWHGLDSEEPANHRWSGSGLPPGAFISLSTCAVAECLGIDYPVS